MSSSKIQSSPGQGPLLRQKQVNVDGEQRCIMGAPPAGGPIAAELWGGMILDNKLTRFSHFSRKSAERRRESFR